MKTLWFGIIIRISEKEMAIANIHLKGPETTFVIAAGEGCLYDKTKI